MREKLETLSLTTLKDLAKQEGIKGISGLRKAEIIDLLCEQEEKGKQEKETAAPAPAKQAPAPKTQENPNYSVWGHKGEFLVFFGQTAQGASRQMSVSNLSGSVTISSVANRLNDLLNALRNYNLIK